ncbi:tail fiber domain-containing protein [Xanthomonas campestris]|uniref:tail fiber domain-containing protein n=1 Tax=Xanthomonas campestris TaxID=339 RepID=UPI000E1E4A8C|nr:hypothetical protein [Xanthomonas campestris]
MARQTIDLTTVNPDGKIGDPARTAFTKTNDNFNELYNLSITIAGNKTFSGIAKITGGSAAPSTPGSYGLISSGAFGGGLALLDGANYMGMRLENSGARLLFAFGGSSMTTVLGLSSGGNLFPSSDNVGALGVPGNRWSAVYAVNGTIQTSDEREKSPVRTFTDNEVSAAVELSRRLGMFQWLEAMQRKGTGARWHTGMTVQSAIQVLQDHGLDPFAYGFVCYDAWAEQEEVEKTRPAEYDDEGKLTRAEETYIDTPYVPAGDRYSFRYDQLLAFIARGMEERLSRLEAMAA